MGMGNIELRVRTYNEAAIALYEKAGFRRVGVLKEVARVGEDWVDEYIYQHMAPQSDWQSIGASDRR